jgi:class 3 adenylate cyclase
LAFVALGLSLRQPAGTEPLDLPTATLTDTTVDRGIDAVLALPENAWSVPERPPFRSVTATLRYVWLRITLPPASSQAEANQTWIAEMDEPLFWELDFYLVEDGRVLDQARTGQDRPAAPQLLALPHTAYGVHRGVGRERHLYVRSMTQGDTIPPVAIRDESTYAVLATRRGILFGALLGGLLGTAACSAVLVFALRDRMYLKLLMLQLSITGIGVYSTGTLSLIDPALSQSYMAFQYVVLALSLVACLSANLFSLQFIRFDADVSPHLLKLIRESIAICSLTLCVLPFLKVVPALVVISAAITYVAIRMSLALSGQLGQRHAFHSQTAFLILIAAIAITLLTYFGVVPGNLRNKQTYLIGAVFMGATLGLGTAARVLAMQEERRRIIASLTRAPAGDQAFEQGASSNSVLDVTVMFVDIASFSLISRNMPPSEVFAILARRLKEIRRIINEAGGTIDRSLGDGVLCFFDRGKGDAAQDHAVAALDAAQRIQELTVQPKPEGAGAPAMPVMPVRIGIHSTRVVVGNLGGNARIDFTMIGAGVNFASRLETACNPFKVALSRETRDRLVAAGFDADSFSEIAVAIKHQESLVSAYEFDPLQSAPAALANAEKRYMAQLGLKRSNARFRLRAGCQVELRSEHGTLVVLDFSLLGFKAQSDVLLGRGTLTEVELISNSADLQDLLEESLMSRFEVEVRWSRKAGQRFEHGLRIHGGSSRQSALLLRWLEQYSGEPADTQGAPLDGMLA